MDECNSAIGLASSYLVVPDSSTDEVLRFDQTTLKSRLEAVQRYMFDLGAHLATPRGTTLSQVKISKTVFSTEAAAQLEAWIDDMDPKLKPLTTFVLPGGHPASAALHLARTIARRAERAVIPMLSENPPQIDQPAYIFLNRLSDFLFVAARFANHIMHCPEVPWKNSNTH